MAIKPKPLINKVIFYLFNLNRKLFS